MTVAPDKIEAIVSIVEKKIINILVVDDDEILSLPSFLTDVKKYNNDHRNDYEVIVKAVSDPIEAVQLLYEFRYHAFVCDHNMPLANGLDLIKYLQLQFGDPLMVYVLWTGGWGGNNKEEIVKDCKDSDILFFRKSDVFSYLIELITEQKEKKMSKVEMNLSSNSLSMDDKELDESIYGHLLPDIINGLEKLQKEDPEFKLFFDGISYNPNQIIEELNKKEKVGRKMVMKYLDGLKFQKNYNK